MEQRQFTRQLRQTMTDAECLLWRHLRAHRLGGQKFRRQQPIGPYVVDFVHFSVRLIVEIDGGQHNGSERDRQRDAWLRTQGFEVMRFWNNDVLLETEAVLSAIREAVVERWPPLPQPLVSLDFDVQANRFGRLSTAREPCGRKARGRAFGVDDWPFVASPNSCWLAVQCAGMHRPRICKDGL